MPEGDTLYRIASNVRPVLEGRQVEQAFSQASPTVAAIDAGSLIGRRVMEVNARGKHLFLLLDDGRAIHSHLGMTGSWHVYPAGEPWRRPTREAGLALRTAEHDVVNFNPKLLTLTSHTRLRRNTYLRRLGPDLLSPELDLEEVLRRVRVHNAAPIGEAVMNQTIACGIGNIYKSETLYITRVNPWTPVGEMTDQRLLGVYAEARRLMRLNRHNGRRTTRFRSDGRRFWVYGRSGESCYECGREITIRRQGDAGRTTYWCTACQPC